MLSLFTATNVTKSFKVSRMFRELSFHQRLSTVEQKQESRCHDLTRLPGTFFLALR